MIISIEKAADIIKQGGIVAIPTETVYGLAADAFQTSAVNKIFETKGRPADNPLIVHISDIEQLDLLAQNIPESARLLAEQFWPGPLSMVLDRQNSVPDIVTAGLQTVAVRMPNHPVALELISKAGPLTAPSANKSGLPSPTRPSHIIEDYEGKVPVLEGGPSEIGLESTVLDLSGNTPTILRHGAITADMIQNIINLPVEETNSSLSLRKSPGTRYTHYKPSASVRWFGESDVETPLSPDIYYLFHTNEVVNPAENIHTYRGNLESFARDLFDHFRTADHLGYSQILVESFKKNDPHQLSKALRDRINRASD